MKNTARLAAAILSAASATSLALASDKPEDLDILKSYAADFEKDPSLDRATSFGVKVGDIMYAIDARPAEGAKPASVTVSKGAPATPTFYFTVEDSTWLARVARGEMNALTSMAKAFESDKAPMDIEVMDGFQPSEDFVGWVVPFTFHFWTKGLPEVVPFSPAMTRETHGANAGVFYYQPGLRSAWVEIKPGQHVNENEKSRTNPFPSMLIITEGETLAIVGGVRRTIKGGEMLFIPPEVSHEFFNESDAPARGFLLMFGDGA